MLALLLLAAAPSLDFGEAPIAHPVPLPEPVLHALIDANRSDLEACRARGDEPGVPLAAYFAATPVDLDGDGTNDLVVTTGQYCLDGAHGKPFWLFLKTKSGWVQRFPETGRGLFDGFSVSAQKHHGLRDVVTQNHTAVRMVTAQWTFDGTRYVATTCWEQDLVNERRRSVPCVR
jgi:hypothetical protein